MKCADCKHWTGPMDYRRHGLGECEKALTYWSATKWDDSDDFIDRVEIDSSNLMYVQDGSDYAAYLLTKADFFCANFEGKEP